MDSKIPGNLLTTAMAVMPHTDMARALETALTLDVPFWPQLPNYSYYEDMYVQAAEHFPGIVLDVDKRTLRFSMDKFAEELEATLLQFDDATLFDISETYSAVYHRFLSILDQFFAQVDRPRGIHLCGNPDWDFLLNLDLDVLSLDVYTNAEIFSSYAASIRKFMDRGGVIVWGIVPTGFEAFEKEAAPSMIQRLEDVWKILWSKGIDRKQMIAQSMLSPATCCLVNPDKERTVERAFASVKQISTRLREKYED